MFGERHDLPHEFPNLAELIAELAVGVQPSLQWRAALNLVLTSFVLPEVVTVSPDAGLPRARRLCHSLRGESRQLKERLALATQDDCLSQNPVVPVPW